MMRLTTILVGREREGGACGPNDGTRQFIMGRPPFICSRLSRRALPIPLGLWEILNIWRSNLIFPARPRICWRDKKDECSSLWPFEVPPVLIRVQLSVPIHLAGFLFPLSLFFFAPNVFLRFLIAQERTCPPSGAIVK